MNNEQMSQELGLPAAAIYPQTLNNSNQLTGSVDMSKYRKVMFVVTVGAVTGGGSLVAKLQQATTSAGSYSDITGGAATAVTAASKIITLEVRADQLSAGYQFVKCLLTEGGSQNVVCGCVAIAGSAPQEPANQNDVAAVTQRLVVA